MQLTDASPHPVSGVPVHNLLIIDDESSVCDACREAAGNMGFRTSAAGSPEQAYRILDRGNIGIILLNLKLCGPAGLQALREVRSRCPDSAIIILTPHSSIAHAVQAIKQGAFDYIAEPFRADELRLVLERAAQHLTSAEPRRTLRDSLRASPGFTALVGATPQMERLRRIIGKAAQSSHPVLLIGESGTGKELVARCIHFAGPRRDRPFIPVDCGSMAAGQIESELFGHVRGAVPGAIRAKEGLFSLANGGTVFLDEIGELPVGVQAKLLRAIQEKETHPVGGARSIPVDVRLLAATNRDLEAAVADGSFRRDLYFRLNVLTLRIPPLRERKQDIPLLVEHFLERLARSTGIQKTIGEETYQALMDYEWPGNVRELENCIERAWAMCSGSTLQLSDLPTSIINVQVHMNNPKAGPKIVPLAELERQAILTAIEQLNGDKLLAAKMLGIGKTTLYRKLKEYSTQS